MSSGFTYVLKFYPSVSTGTKYITSGFQEGNSAYRFCRRILWEFQRCAILPKSVFKSSIEQNLKHYFGIGFSKSYIPETLIALKKKYPPVNTELPKCTPLWSDPLLCCALYQIICNQHQGVLLSCIWDCAIDLISYIVKMKDNIRICSIKGPAFEAIKLWVYRHVRRVVITVKLFLRIRRHISECYILMT